MIPPAPGRVLRPLIAAAVLGFAPSLRAQGLAVELEAGYFDMTNARSSAKAVFTHRVGGQNSTETKTSAGGLVFGGALTRSLGRHFYVAASARYFRKTGERVFVLVRDEGSQVFPLGHPLTLRIVPVHAVLGYRFGRRGALAPYAGLGLGLTAYREESTVGGVKDSASETKASGQVIAGVEYGRGRLGLGAEISYSRVPNAVGVSGVSKVYGESDIGGLTVTAKVRLHTRRSRR